LRRDRRGGSRRGRERVRASAAVGRDAGAGVSDPRPSLSGRAPILILPVAAPLPHPEDDADAKSGHPTKRTAGALHYGRRYTSLEQYSANGV
jgi:hypothetical protein